MKHVITIMFETDDNVSINQVYEVVQDCRVQLETLTDRFGINHYNSDCVYQNSAGKQPTDPLTTNCLSCDCEYVSGGSEYCEDCEGHLVSEEENAEPDPQLRAMNTLKKLLTDPAQIAEVEKHIEIRKVELVANAFAKAETFQATTDMDRCTCDISDLCIRGCKCGGK